MELLENIAYEQGLELIETTSERNGYPSNLRKAIIGFDSFEQAQELAERYGLKVQEFERRDGWQLWYRTGDTVYEAYDYEQFWRDGLNEDIEVFKPGEEEEVIEQLKFFLGACENLSAMRCLIDDTEKVLDALNDCEDNQFVVTNCCEYEGTYLCTCMSYQYDTRHYTIGIAE